MTWCADSCGYFARTRAATPETIAVEKLVPAGTSNELSGPSIALIRLSSRGERPTTSVPGAAIPHPRPGDAQFVHRRARRIHCADGQDIVAEPRRSDHRGHAIPVPRIIGVQGIYRSGSLCSRADWCRPRRRR